MEDPNNKPSLVEVGKGIRSIGMLLILIPVLVILVVCLFSCMAGMI